MGGGEEEEVSVTQVRLTEDGLVLAPCAIVTRETLAKTGSVVAKTSSRAITSLLVTVPTEHIHSSRALLQRAVWAAEASIAHASDMLHGVPRLVICGTGLVGELLLGVADTSSAAVVGADGTVAGNTDIVVEASTLSSLSVACSLVGALH